MATYILTSMFSNGFHGKIAEMFQQTIPKRDKFAFVASEFEKMYEKTDKYFTFFLQAFEECGIHFNESYVVDGRMKIDEAQKAVEEADIIWLSGGMTLAQFGYFQKYGLDTIIKQHKGVVIGMSAGSINMAETSICTRTCGHIEQKIYKGLGCVDVSVEPHFVRDKFTEELVELSGKYKIYGLCDESVIVYENGKQHFYGEIYEMYNGKIELVHFER